MCEILYKKIKGIQCRRCRRYTVQISMRLNGMYVGDVEDGICGFYATLYAEYRFMSKMSKILCIQWPLAPPGGKARCSRPSCGFSGSPPCSPRRQLCKLSWTCHTTRVIAGKTHSKSPILKTKGALSNSVILTYLWEQSCILHTLTEPATNK